MPADDPATPPGITLRLVPDPRLYIGRAGNQSVTVDRAAGYAGGTGSGVRGGQLLGMAIGACLGNSLQEIAAETDACLQDVSIDVTMTPNEAGTRILGATLDIAIMADLPRAELEALLEKSLSIWTVALSIRDSLPVTLRSITLNGTTVD